jgi:Fur family zinc uptake transcriptional regulator
MKRHNHNQCKSKSMRNAHEVASQSGKKLTTHRLQVLQILLNDHRAMGAYDILHIMQQQSIDIQNKTKSFGKPQPPTVYRALEFLLDLGLIHKIESQNSYFACTIDKPQSGQHMAQAFICDICGIVEEEAILSAEQAMFKKADGFGFKIEKIIMEFRGTCAICQTKEQA